MLESGCSGSGDSKDAAVVNTHRAMQVMNDVMRY